MKDFWKYVTSGLGEAQIWLVLTSVVSACLATLKTTGLTTRQNIVGVLTGFVCSCLSGGIAMELGCGSWLSCGIGYLAGHVGGSLITALQLEIKRAETNLFGFLGNALNLFFNRKPPTPGP